MLPAQKAFAQGRPPANVVVSPVVEGQVQEKVILIGVAEPWRASNVASEFSGRVQAMVVRRGQVVKKGEVLARLEKSDLPFRLEEAQAKKKATQFRLERAKDILERSESLEKDQAISDKDLKQAQLAVGEIEGDLLAIEAGIRQLKDEAKKKTIRAPFDGVVTRELTEVGEWVKVGGEIVHMVDLSTVRILVDVPERYVSGVKADEDVVVKIDALGPKPIKGKVHALIPEGNREAHLFPLEVHAENKDLQIKEGMLARIEFNLGLARNVMLVHKDAIITRGTQTYLFIVNSENVKQVIVATGKSKGDLIEVTGSLKVGDKAVIRGNERLREGQSVQVVPLSN